MEMNKREKIENFIKIITKTDLDEKRLAYPINEEFRGDFKNLKDYTFTVDYGFSEGEEFINFTVCTARLGVTRGYSLKWNLANPVTWEMFIDKGLIELEETIVPQLYTGMMRIVQNF